MIGLRVTRLRLTAGIGLVCTLLTAACGGTQPLASGSAPTTSGSAPRSVAEIARYQGADRQQLLEAGARKEGAVSWYTVLAGEGVDALTAGFKQKYPFLQVETFRADTAPLFARITQEAQANAPSFDVADTTTPGVLADGNLSAPFFSPTVASLPDNLKLSAPEGLALAATDWTTLASFAYNTKLIPAGAVPKTLEDLANPMLSGKMALAGTTTGLNWVGSILQTMGDEKGRKFLEDFGKQQKPSVQQISGKALLDLIVKGEVPASPTIYRDHVAQAKGAGASVEWVPLEPVVSLAAEVALDAKAPHPHAAMLFIDYCLGPDGQQVLNDHHYSTASEKVPFKFWVPTQGKTTAEYTKQAQAWQDLFKADFR